MTKAQVEKVIAALNVGLINTGIAERNAARELDFRRDYVHLEEARDIMDAYNREMSALKDYVSDFAPVRKPEGI